MNEIAISIHNLTVSYNDWPVLRGITAQIPAKKITGIIGPNGAGKSTLMKAILGLTRKDTGEIQIFGEEIKKAIHKIAYIPQKEQIDWDFPVVVYDVVMMGRYPALGWFRHASKTDHKMVQNALAEVEMQQFSQRHIRMLSGGQQQRVFIARALVQKAEIFLMDEPFVGVDAASQNSILGMIERLKNDGKTILIINHDLSMCKRFDYLMLINKQLVAMGPSDKVYTDENMKRTYGGQTSLIEQAESMLHQGMMADMNDAIGRQKVHPDTPEIGKQENKGKSQTMETRQEDRL